MAIYLKKFETTAEYTAYVATDYAKPNVSYIEEENGVAYHPYVEPSQPNNIITYSASTKLTETTTQNSSGLHTNAFSGASGQLTMTSHTFENGVGTVEFSDDVTSIGFRAFYQCTSLTSIDIPNSVTSIGDEAFDYCRSITSIEIPNSVTSIGRVAFGDCSGLTNCTIGNGVTSISSMAFSRCSGLTSVTIGSGVTSIGENAFNNCRSLTSIVIPSGVTSIGGHAFYQCTSLTSCTIGNGVTSIGSNTFASCTSLTSCAIGNSVTNIDSGAFSNCTSLTSITIPNSVTSIGSLALNTVQYLTCNGVTYTANTNSTYSSRRGYWITLGNGQQAFISVENIECCFVAGTKVTMYDLSTKNIENVQIGDRVLSYDLDSGENIITTVKRTITHENTTNIATITLENGYTATMNEYHPILCNDGWHSITNYEGFTTLVVGDMVKVQDGYSRLASIERSVVEPFITYNLDVINDEEVERNDNDANDNYYANGICAHNTISC